KVWSYQMRRGRTRKDAGLAVGSWSQVRFAKRAAGYGRGYDELCLMQTTLRASGRILIDLIRRGRTPKEQTVASRLRDSICIPFVGFPRRSGAGHIGRNASYLISKCTRGRR